MVAKVFVTPFANAGNANAVPDATQPGGEVSYNVGFGPDYERQLGVDPLAKNIEREDWNGVLKDVTTSLREMQSGLGVVPYNATLMAALAGGVYPKGAVIPDASGDFYWRANAATAVDPATVGQTDWRPHGYIASSLSIALTNVNVTLTSYQAAFPTLIFTGALTGNVVITVPSWAQSYVIDNRCTGAFTVTLRTTVLGSVAVVPNGQETFVFITGNSAVDTNAAMFGGFAIQPYSAAFAASLPGGVYPAGSVVVDSSKLGYWQATVDTSADPASTTANWRPVNWTGSHSQALTNVNVTLTSQQAARPLIILTGALTANVQVILPLWAGRPVTIDNRCTGAFTVTIIGPTGTGEGSPNGSNLTFVCTGANFNRADVDNSGALTPTLVNSYVDAGDTQYWRIDGVTHLSIDVARATVGALPLTLFTLPVGFRPAVNQRFMIACSATGAFGQGACAVNTAGVVSLASFELVASGTTNFVGTGTASIVL